jgi:glutaminase
LTPRPLSLPEGVDAVSWGLAELHRLFLPSDDGEVADYIPQLALADRDSFGLALVSMDGHRYRAGDSDLRFTLQSVTKPFVLALALAELGPAEVGRRVGCEPSGEAFNAISLDHATGRPANPMINAGAIAVTALVPAAGPDERFARILDGLGRFAGRPLDVDEDVYRSESETGDRNRALAYLMRGTGALSGDPVEAAETYFRQCSVRADVLPAKSGVSGGLVAVSPDRFGVAVHSPPLDPVGNSVRGVAAVRELSERFGLHLMHNAAPGAATVTLATTHHDGRIALVAARGALDFTAAERVLFALAERTPDRPGWVVLDLERATAADETARAMLHRALTLLADDGHRVIVVGNAPAGGLPAGDPWELAATREQALARAEQGVSSS